MTDIRGDVITKEMRQRVTIRESERGAWNFEVKRPTLTIEALLKNGYIDPYHEEYGLYFMGLRNAWLSPFTYRHNSMYREIMEFFSIPGYAADLYSLIRHEIGLPYAEYTVMLIERAFNTAAPDILQAVVGEQYFKEFERMVVAIDNLRKKTLADA